MEALVHRRAQSVAEHAKTGRGDATRLVYEYVDDIEEKSAPSRQAPPGDVFRADTIILGSTENSARMSDAAMDFRDCIFCPRLERPEAMPFAVHIHAGLGGNGK